MMDDNYEILEIGEGYEIGRILKGSYKRSIVKTNSISDLLNKKINSNRKE